VFVVYRRIATAGPIIIIVLSRNKATDVASKVNFTPWVAPHVQKRAAIKDAGYRPIPLSSAVNGSALSGISGQRIAQGRGFCNLPGRTGGLFFDLTGTCRSGYKGLQMKHPADQA